jgi:D-threo-aldose 1-dehydrogenase
MNRPSLPRFGMGTAMLGNLYRTVSDEEAYATVAAALAAGIRYFDTAPYYGFGLAERRLGSALAALDPGADALVSTKVGRLLRPTAAGGERHGFVDADPYEPFFDYTADGIHRSFAASAQRLRGRRVDLLLAHDLGRVTHGEDHVRHLRDFLDGGYRAMSALRDGGAAGAIGIGVNEVAICHALLDRVDLDIILLAGRYTLLDRSGARLLDRCAARGVRVIVGGPYNSGILARDPADADPGGAHYDYAPPADEIVGRTRALGAACAAAGVALPAAALHFPLRHPAVACVVAGVIGTDQVDDLTTRMATAMPAGLWAAIDAGVDRAAAGGASAGGQLILLHPDDNVLICVSPIAAGDVIPVSGGTIPAREGITVGHKVARVTLSTGDKVIKYGAPIGSMTAAATTGEWVHMHNMRSDYIASHTRATISGERT